MPRSPVALLTSALDIAMDKSLVLGYSRIGIAARGCWWPADPAPDSLAGQHVIVTGASSGLGRATAAGLARLGATVHLVGRSQQRLEESAELIRADVPHADLLSEVCDISDLDAVRAYAAKLRERGGALHAIVHDAGLMPPERAESAQGHELTLATHVLGPLLLTEELRDMLAAAASPRVIIVSSGGMYSAPLDDSIGDDIEYEQSAYDPVRAYARTKRIQVTLAEQLAHRLRSQGIAVHSMHPGWADTPGVTDSLPRFAKIAAPILRTPAQGADTIVWLTAAEEAARSTGEFWCDRRPRPTYYLSWQSDDPSARRRVWTYAARATGIAQTPG
ncbi:dehydrogenase [Aeromicrobium sp. A1-2]|uniref:SDR family NAD(P)-dependent oxidoreductase n=1 Tax=Aeromicrobium sp. A1-2 TaxID=2107713 RepID=UPI000E49DF84|nr:SDR family NAD(P)-dependent oxidoreductase [Aeromicrobium sp. A1-2]AXT85245.1 dehydrogenase [Aeromicrobium sp. A1-2]